MLLDEIGEALQNMSFYLINLSYGSLLERLMEPAIEMFNPDEWTADWSDVGFNNYQNLFPFPLVGLNQIW